VGTQNLIGKYALGATTDDGNTASSDLLALIVSPGKAYIKGYELEKLNLQLRILTKQENLKLSMLVSQPLIRVTMRSSQMYMALQISQR
jgi:hypothetical protein